MMVVVMTMTNEDSDDSWENGCDVDVHCSFQHKNLKMSLSDAPGILVIDTSINTET